MTYSMVSRIQNTIEVVILYIFKDNIFEVVTLPNSKVSRIQDTFEVVTLPSLIVFQIQDTIEMITLPQYSIY